MQDNKKVCFVFVYNTTFTQEFPVVPVFELPGSLGDGKVVMEDDQLARAAGSLEIKRVKQINKRKKRQTNKDGVRTSRSQHCKNSFSLMPKTLCLLQRWRCSCKF
jgi:hypothetical protein